MTILQWYQITEDYVILRFNSALDVDNFVNANFTLDNTDATPSAISDPFDEIVVERDYQSTSRELYLYWNVDLLPDTDYTLSIINQQSLLGSSIPTETIEFSTDGLELATPNLSESEFTKEPTNIEDYSIKTVADLSTATGTGGLTESDEEFGIVSISPDVHESYYLGPYDYNGKIEITFNHSIPSNFVNSTDFKLQKKAIDGRMAVAWTTVATRVAQHTLDPIISIYLPSTDATPVYSYEVEDISEYTFWEEGYKYRLVISKSVGY